MQKKDPDVTERFFSTVVWIESATATYDIA